MKRRNWFWGLFFILAAVLVIASSFGVFASGIGFWTMVATAGLLAILAKSIPSRNFAGILVPLALGYLLYQGPLGLPKISVWILLGSAILMSIGLQMIFRKKPDYNWDYSSSEWGTRSNCSMGWSGDNKNQDDPDYVVLEGEGQVQSPHQPDLQAEHGGDDNHPYATVKLGAASKYIHGQAVETGYFKCNLGALEVYFDEANLAPDGADIFIDASLAGVSLYIPRHWRVKPEMNVVIGGVEEAPHKADPDGPELRISGNITMSGLELKYV